MGKRASWVVAFLGFVLWISGLVAVGSPSISHEVVMRSGFAELLVDTPFGNYVFSEDGGTLRSILLTFAPYGSSVAELVPGIAKYSVGDPRPYFDNVEFPFELIHDAPPLTYTLQDPVYTERGAIVVELRGEGDGWAVVKRFTIEPDALYTVNAEIQILSSPARPDSLRMVLANRKRDHRDLVFLYNNVPRSERLAPSPDIAFQGLGVMDKEVVLFLSPEQGTTVLPFAEDVPSSNGDERNRIGVQLVPGSEGDDTYRFVLYGGRRRFITLEAAGLEALDQTGIFARMMVYMIRFLDWLYARTGNYGWAIILFTIVTRILLFPLMRKQYHSMAKMQQIQPMLKRVQAKYKDNREEMQRKILEIYRKEKVNPMSGCFPMAVQLPLIVLIWRALLYAAEQIHLSPGFLWIPDLSLHDPYYILVVVTTVIMLLQQHFMAPMTPTETSGPQKYMGYFFPVLMAFLLWRFPAGLWLYYLLTTAAQVGQQAIVNREMARAGGGTISLSSIETESGSASDPESDDGASS